MSGVADYLLSLIFGALGGPVCVPVYPIDCKGDIEEITIDLFYLLAECQNVLGLFKRPRLKEGFRSGFGPDGQVIG